MTVPFLEDDARLLADCEVHTHRASGPGGQKRNKTESAVRIVHRPTGISVVATESRSQHENRARALRRLRKALALRVRTPVVADEVPASLTAAINTHGRLTMGQRDARYLPAASALLDLLAACAGSVGEIAKRLNLSTANVAAFITADDDLLAEANRLRGALGLKPLRKD